MKLLDMELFTLLMFTEGLYVWWGISLRIGLSVPCRFHAFWSCYIVRNFFSLLLIDPHRRTISNHGGRADRQWFPRCGRVRMVLTGTACRVASIFRYILRLCPWILQRQRWAIFKVDVHGLETFPTTCQPSIGDIRTAAVYSRGFASARDNAVVVRGN